MANTLFKKSSGRRVTVAAAAFAACLTMSPLVFAQTTYTGADNVSGAGQFDTSLTGDYTVNSGSTFDVKGGNALPPASTPAVPYYGEGALSINGSFTNRGSSQIGGGDAGDSTFVITNGQTGYGGTGLEVSGDVHNYNLLDVVGGRSENCSSNSVAQSWGGTGLNAVNGTLYNHAGTITATGGIGYNHSARGGTAVEAKDLVNSAAIDATGGYSTMDTQGGGGFPMGGNGIHITNTMTNNAGATVTGGVGDMHTNCNHAGMGGNGLMVDGTAANYGVLDGKGGAAQYSAVGGGGYATGGLGMTFGGLVTNYQSGQVLAMGGTPDSAGDGRRKGGTGINFGGGIINYSNSFTAEGASFTNSSSYDSIGGMGITVGPEQFWTGLSNATFDFKVENHGTIKVTGGVGSTTGTGISVTGGDGMGVASYFWYNDSPTMNTVDLTAEVINKGTIIAAGGDAESVNTSAAGGGNGFTLGGGTLLSGMSLTINSTQNHGVIVATGGDARSTSTGNSSGGWGMKLIGGTL